MKKTMLIALTLVVLCLVLAACSGNSGTQQGGNATQAPSGSEGLTFVAADKTNWDKEINIGDYAYTIAINFENGGAISVVGTCTGRAAASSGNQGMGMGMGGGQQEGEAATEAPALTDAEKAAQNFTKTGTWTLEEGYGYTVTIDGYTTKTDYDKASGRHYFYAVINGSDLTQFQGKDSEFRKTLAADYDIFEARDAQYFFYGTGTTMTGNASSTKVYLEKDGTANALTQQGSSPSYARGTWSENPDKSLTVNIDGADDCDYCDIAGKEGYRLYFNDTAMYTSVSGANVDYTDKDFEGETLKTLYCAEQDYTLELTEKGFAVVYKGADREKTGKYTDNGGVLTVRLGDKEYVSENGQISLEFESSNGSGSGNSEAETRTFNLDGSVPEGGAPAGPGEGGSGGEGGEGGDTGNGGEGGEG